MKALELTGLANIRKRWCGNKSQSASQDWNILSSPSSELITDSQCPIRAITARLEAPSEGQALAVGAYRGRSLRNPQLTQFVNGAARFWKTQNCEENLEMLRTTEWDPRRVTQRGKRAEKIQGKTALLWSWLAHACFLLAAFSRIDMAARRPQIYTRTGMCLMA